MSNRACPACFTFDLRTVVEAPPVKMETPDGPKQLTQVVGWKCLRCGWKGQKNELVSLSKLSVKKLGKLRSHMKRRR